MAVVSLIEAQRVACPDAWHHVNAPGGYEIWHFDAQDPANGLLLTAKFRLGSFAHAGYWQHYRTFLKSPTRNAPPLPAEYPSVQFDIFEGGKLTGEFLHALAAADFSGSDQRLDVKMGRHFVQASDCSISLHLEAQAENISADLMFHPAWNQSSIDVNYLSNAAHQWVLANPLHNVTGQIRLGNRTIEFAGPGYRDYRYGTHPPGDAVFTLFRGRVLSKEKVATFTLAQNAQLIVATPGGISQRSTSNLSAQWRRNGLFGLRYPSRLSLDDYLHLTNPRIVNVRANASSLIYDAVIEGDAASAFCEILKPRRVPGKWFKRTGGAHG